MHYVQFVVAGDSDSKVADKVGVNSSTIGRWRTGAVDPKPRQVVAFARAYNVSPIGALIAADYVSETDLDIPVTSPRLDSYSTYELLSEVQTRLLEAMSYSGLVSWPGSDKPDGHRFAALFNPGISPDAAKTYLQQPGAWVAVPPEVAESGWVLEEFIDAKAGTLDDQSYSEQLLNERIDRNVGGDLESMSEGELQSRYDLASDTSVDNRDDLGDRTP
ncbi:hypothetical protein B7R22_16920 [Subtercola boreus]|uniref:HTH cro/C1-type domain-containing protein n=2 Tax=Subtercola boreus TaxID=120213 RepID=A0A3E0VRT6_9MICO|nr:hypothetical protein B7R22_16920 [Subtercola boreus]